MQFVEFQTPVQGNNLPSFRGKTPDLIRLATWAQVMISDHELQFASLGVLAASKLLDQVKIM